MTKPQAVPLMVPFAAWFLARGGPVGLLRATLLGAAVALVLWLPFLAAGGPVRYLEALADYQNDFFSLMSVRAWNLWWLVQEVQADGQMVSDRVEVFGPVTLRHLGFVIAGLLAAFVGAAVWRDPRPRTLILGSTAITLVAFGFLTTMHERYAYAAIIVLLLLIPEPAVRRVSVVLGVVYVLNLVAAVPATAELGSILGQSGPIWIAGSIVMLAVTGWSLVALTRGARQRESPPTVVSVP
jgi:hypothetical protein